MTVRLHIERVVIDPQVAGTARPELLRQALEAELSGLLAAGGTEGLHRRDVKVDRVGAALEAADLRSGGFPSALAQSVYGSLKR